MTGSELQGYRLSLHMSVIDFLSVAERGSERAYRKWEAGDHPVPDDIAKKMLSLVAEYNQRVRHTLASGYIRTWDEAKDIFPNRAVWRVNNAAVSAQNIKKGLQTSEFGSIL